MALKAENITKRFGDTTVLDGFTHEFAEGRVTAVTGRSGCGKTTLLYILMGLTAPDSGTVTGGGAKMSAVFQENRLCENLTVLSNLRLVMRGKPSRAELERELAAVGLTDCADKPVRELSGGMKRRVALLRALLADHELLLLDEPFKGLDETTKGAVMEYCRSRTEGKTVILVTHDPTEAEFFDAEPCPLTSPEKVQ